MRPVSAGQDHIPPPQDDPCTDAFLQGRAGQMVEFVQRPFC